MPLSDIEEAIIQQSRTASASQVRQFILHSTIGLVISLSIASVVNGAILIVSASQFYNPDPTVPPPGISEAYALLHEYLGALWAVIFAVSLLLSGQSATITATMAGSVVMEGFLDLRLRPWVRRIITRSLAIVPAMVVSMAAGQQGLDGLLVLSQVILSFQLPFSIFPLVFFTSRKALLRDHASSLPFSIFCYALAAVLGMGNVYVLFHL